MANSKKNLGGLQIAVLSGSKSYTTRPRWRLEYWKCFRLLRLQLYAAKYCEKVQLYVSRERQLTDDRQTTDGIAMTVAERNVVTFCQKIAMNLQIIQEAVLLQRGCAMLRVCQ